MVIGVILWIYALLSVVSEYGRLTKQFYQQTGTIPGEEYDLSTMLLIGILYFLIVIYINVGVARMINKTVLKNWKPNPGKLRNGIGVFLISILIFVTVATAVILSAYALMPYYWENLLYVFAVPSLLSILYIYRVIRHDKYSLLNIYIANDTTKKIIKL